MDTFGHDVNVECWGLAQQHDTTTQSSRQGLEPRPLDPKSGPRTIRPPRLLIYGEIFLGKQNQTSLIVMTVTVPLYFLGRTCECVRRITYCPLLWLFSGLLQVHQEDLSTVRGNTTLLLILPSPGNHFWKGRLASNFCSTRISIVKQTSQYFLDVTPHSHN